MSLYSTRNPTYPSPTLYPGTLLFPSAGLVYRQVFIDLQDGDGWRDISGYVQHKSLTITQRAFSDDFHYAINQATFTCNYFYDLYDALLNSDDDILVRINLHTDFTDEVLFNGFVVPNASRTYDGILENMPLKLEATDSTTKLDKEIGDIVYRNYYVMNPNDIPRSIVHQLAYRAGFTDAQIDQTIIILDTLNGFSPASAEDSILTVLDQLLFEYGYTLSFNASDQISPVQWVKTSDTPEFAFTESNIIGKARIQDNEITYEGAEVTYYELGDRPNSLVYTEDLPIDSLGNFEGYAILANTLYPPEANVIDTTTEQNQVVYQEYEDTSIKYFTNKAITDEKLKGYNYKAFTSDFSGIIATSEHRVDFRADASVLVLTSEYTTTVDGESIPTFGFWNKKARIIFRNTSPTVSQNIYYFQIYADILYRKMERKAVKQNVTNTKKVNKYTAQFVYSSTRADSLAIALANSYYVGNTTYTIESEFFAREGAVVSIVMGDGTNQKCLVTERQLDEATSIYTYTLRAYAINTGTVTKQNVGALPVAVSNNTVYSRLSSYAFNIPTDSEGNNPDLTNASFTAHIYRGGIDETAGWTLTPTVYGLTGSFGVGVYFNKYTILTLAFGIDTGYVDIVASKTGFANITMRCVTAKAKVGSRGSPGATGTSVTWQGDLASPPLNPEAGWAYHNTTDRKAYVYQDTPPSGWYVMTEDGVNGIDGMDSYSAILSNEALTLSAYADGTVPSLASAYTYMRIFLGDVDISDSQTYSATTSGCTGSFDIGASLNKFMVATFTNDIGYADITASGTGHPNITKRFSLAKSRYGINARTVDIVLNIPAIVYNSEGITPNPTSVTISGLAQNTIATPYYEFLINDTTVQNTTANSYAYTVPSGWANTPVKIAINLRETNGTGTILASDQYALVGVKDSVNGITVALSNEAHTLPVDIAGTITYSGSGSAIQAWEGGTALTVDQNAPYGNSTFRVTASGLNITPGTPSGNDGTYSRIYGDHSAMAANTASIVYTITVKNSTGVESVITKTQSFSKAVAGINSRTVNLVSDSTVFTYTPEGATASPVSAVLTATALNTLGTVYYDFLKNGVSVQNTTGNTYAYTPPTTYTTSADIITVNIREGAGTGIVLASDQISLIGVKNTTNGFSSHLSNAADVVSVNDGVIDYTGSGTTINIWEGSLALNEDSVPAFANSTFRVTASGTNITPGTVSGQGTPNLVYGAHSNMTADAAFVTYTITVKSASGVESVFTRVQAITKALQGINAEVYWIDISSLVISLDKNSVVLPSTLTVNARKQSNGVVSDYDGRFKIYHDEVLFYTSSGDESEKVYDPKLYPSATLYPGTVLYPLIPKTVRVELYASGGTTSKLDSQSVIIVSDGIDGSSGTDGTAGANGNRVAILELYKWAATVPTSSWPTGYSTYTWATGLFTEPATPNGWSINPGSAVVGQTLYATRVVYSDTDTSPTDTIGWPTSGQTAYEVGYAGANGTRTASIELYKWSATLPSDTWPIGTSTYTWATGAFTAPATLNGWSLTPATPVLGQTLYLVRAVYADSLTTATSDITWPASPTPSPVSAAGINGKTISPNITASLYSITWDAEGLNPSPAVSPEFSAQLYVDGVSTTAGVTYAWTSSGQLSGTSSIATFTPAIVNPGFGAVGNTGVRCQMTYDGVVYEARSSVSVAKSPAGIDWVADWTGSEVQTTYAGGRPYILAAGIYAGTVEDDPSNPGYKRVDQGIFMGKGAVSGITGDFFGLVAIDNAGITFKIDGTTGDATFRGSITGSEITAGTGNDIARISVADPTYRIWVGHDTAALAPFRVTKTGGVTMDSAAVNGSFTLGSGQYFTAADGLLRITPDNPGTNRGEGLVFASNSRAFSVPTALSGDKRGGVQRIYNITEISNEHFSIDGTTPSIYSYGRFGTDIGYAGAEIDSAISTRNYVIIGSAILATYGSISLSATVDNDTRGVQLWNQDLTGSFRPTVSNNVSLGDSNYKWRSLYLHASNTTLDTQGSMSYDTTYKSFKTFSDSEVRLSGVIGRINTYSSLTDGTDLSFGATIPTNFWVVGKRIRITVYGVTQASEDGEIYTLRALIGTTVIAQTAFASITGAYTFKVVFETVCTLVGTSGDLYGNAVVNYNTTVQCASTNNTAYNTTTETGVLAFDFASSATGVLANVTGYAEVIG